MILFFDTYITDKPLVKSFVEPNNKIRLASDSYRMPRKIDIAKYTLLSYASYPWAKVIIRYGFSSRYTKAQVAEFRQFVKKLYPGATIIENRKPILVQKDFQPIIRLVEKSADNWIFYSPNNDHPMTCANYQGIENGIQIASKYTKTHPHVSIVYSHFSEFIRLGFPDSKFHQRYAQDGKLIEETPEANVFLRENGDNSSIQIVNKNLFAYWFASQDLKDAPIMRAEDIREHFLTKNQIMVVPKTPICEHFDGYSHTIGGINEIEPDCIPPLFIPKGIFSGNIKIAFGYSKYKNGYINCNPLAEKYVFRDKIGGTDLKKAPSQLPFFWRGKVRCIEISPQINWTDMSLRMEKEAEKLVNPWDHQPFSTVKQPILAKALSRLRSAPVNKKQLDLIADKQRLAATGLLYQKKLIKLHIGCGPRILKGWVNIDLMYEPYENYLQYYTNKHYPPQIRGTKNDFYAFNIARESLPFADNSVEVVFHEDFIEHLDQKEQIMFLAEMRRVLKPGGVHRINTPNLLSSMKQHSYFDLGIAGVYQTEWDKHVHKNILTPAMLAELALMVGYKKVTIKKRNHSKAKGLPLEYRPDPHDRPEDGNIFADLIK